MPTFRHNTIDIAFDRKGNGDPVLLIHGFPQTGALWTQVAEGLSDDFTLIMPDLRGYGASSKPVPLEDLSNYSFRAMGQDLIALMRAEGFERFHLVGHDRGARVAYRLARDVPEAVATLTLMDIVPTDHLVETCDYALARAYFHWSFLAQPAPLPERMIGADPDLFFEACLLGWGGANLDDFPKLSVYRAAWRDPSAIAGMINDYRAAVEIDLKHDSEDDGIVTCPSLVLYGESGVMARSYDVAAVWRERLPDMRIGAIPGGHFFVDQAPEETRIALAAFLLEHSV